MLVLIKNKLSITNQLELAREEEVITKRKALELFDQEIIYEFEVGTIKGLQQIHQYLFEDIYFFAGKIRDTNFSKGNFRFATTIYLKEILPKIDKDQQLYNVLLEERPKIARFNKLTEDEVYTDRVASYLVKMKPKTKEALDKIFDFRKENIEIFGEYLLRVINKHIE